MGIRGELFSTKVLLENRTYFFNVKENRMGDLYLNIVESKNRDSGGFERQSVILFEEDLPEFLQGFDESLRVMEKAAREKKRKGPRQEPRGGYAGDEERPAPGKIGRDGEGRTGARAEGWSPARTEGRTTARTGGRAADKTRFEDRRFSGPGTADKARFEGRGRFSGPGAKGGVAKKGKANPFRGEEEKPHPRKPRQLKVVRRREP
jgi:hypothetical protein